MQHQGTTYQLPAGYRFTLALSLALLAHILLLSGLPSIIDQPEHAPPTVQIELVAASHTTPRASAQSTSERQPEPDLKPSEHSSAPQLLQKPATHDAPKKPQKTQNLSANRSERVKDKGAPKASQTPSKAQSGAKDQSTIISQSPDETDPYLVELQLLIAKELEKVGGYKVSILPEPVTIRIQLNLLDNGALTRARIVKPTGNTRIDNAAYKATLAASPFPEPPTDNKNQNRFEVELKFSPKRF